MHLIEALANAAPLAAASWLTDWHNWNLIAQVAVGLGAVIFVHELGHFLVAKACGVKCEKFYLGFDVFGLKLAKFRWGETEYGIGILPLGGYVKMLGQEDNPTKAAEEFERAKLAREAAEGDTLPEGEASAETSIFDPRSYLAKTVPQRMAIISAGVIMNVIFAFAVAVIAYKMGVKENPCVVGRLWPGDPAWTAGLRPGDKIIRIGDIENPRFRNLQQRVALGDNLDKGVKFVVEREGASEPLEFTIYPDPTGLAPRIGIFSASTTQLAKPPIVPVAPLGGKDSPFKPGDTIAAIAGKNVATNADVQRELAQNVGPTTVTVLRKLNENDSEQVPIELPGRPLKRLGIAMEIGAIAAVQAGSPADKAGWKKGDLLVSIDGEPIGDPETLNDRLLKRAGQEVTIVTRRDGQQSEQKVTLREPYAVEDPLTPAEPLVLNTLGVGIRVTTRVASVEPGGPAEKAGIAAGAEVVAARLPPQNVKLDDKDVEFKVEFGEAADKASWPFFVEQLQNTLADTKVTLTLADKREVEVDVAASNEWNPDRGFNFEPLYVEVRAATMSEALKLGSNEAVESVAQVYRFLRKIGTAQVSPKGMGGPLSIFGVAHQSASKGVSALLIFLGMLSANLAVLNFLPIPLLDGGHMVFLILEGIRGKPVSERVVIAFHYAGFLFIISLMTFVFALDLGWISRLP
ncbi:MAG TPA: site-2 protease family protein [Pirellulales bacterium]|nr:site-2 protease family protein [Pirellulales bacterium]